MWIESIALYRNNEPLKYQIPSLHGTRLNPESIIVELAFSNKVTGYGESTPRFYVTGETCASVIKIVQKYPEDIIQKALTQVKHIPDEKIKKSRGALFTYMLKKYANEK